MKVTCILNKWNIWPTFSGPFDWFQLNAKVLKSIWHFKGCNQLGVSVKLQSYVNASIGSSDHHYVLSVILFMNCIMKWSNDPGMTSCYQVDFQENILFWKIFIRKVDILGPVVNLPLGMQTHEPSCRLYDCTGRSCWALNVFCLCHFEVMWLERAFRWWQKTGSSGDDSARTRVQGIG